MTVLSPQLDTVARLQPMRITGSVAALRGLVVLIADLPLPVGSLVRIDPSAAAVRGRGAAGAAHPDSLGEIVGFDGRHTIVMMLSDAHGIRPGDRVVGLQSAPTVGVGSRLLGRVIDGLGRPIDDLGPIMGTSPRAIDPPPPGPLQRRRITEPLHTGVRAIDLFTTLGRGQRMGVFAGPGVGKSTLLGTIARNAASDVNVIALVGERGREVRDFIEHNLGKDGLAKSVVVVSTSDQSPLLRIRAAMVACTIAEHFRDGRKQVLLLMDSVTRLAHAQRQIGLSVGEPPATRGYTPSVFSLMARLLERAGAMADVSKAPDSAHPTSDIRHPTSPGSITGLYTVLVEGDEMTEPVADAARGILDGHLILSRALAHKAHFPAIDVLDSISRVAEDVSDEAHIAARRQVIRLLAAYREVEDLIQIGAYARGSNPETDVAIRYHQQFVDLLRQGSKEIEPFAQSRSRLVKLAVESGAALQQVSQAQQPQARRGTA